MSVIHLNTKFLRVELGNVAHAFALARSWQEGRVSPDELLETEDGERLTFREACARDGFLHDMIGVLPEFKPQKERSWREERRFRKDIWRRVVDDGDYVGLATLYGRIEERDGRIAELSVGIRDAESAKMALEKEVVRSAAALAVANDSLAAARRVAEAADRASKEAEERAEAARLAAKEALRGKRYAEHAWDARGRNEVAAKGRIAKSIGIHMLPQGGTHTVMGPNGIPDDVLLKSIRRWARDVAPADVLAIHAGRWFSDGSAGIIVTAVGVVGSGGCDGKPVCLQWGEVAPVSVRGNLLSAVEVIAGGIVLSRFPTYFLNAGGLKKFVSALAVIEADIGG